MNSNTRAGAVPSLLLCTVLAIIISGCSTDHANTNPINSDSISDITTTSPSTLAWDAPSSYTDSTPLTESDLKEYRIYFSTQSGTFSAGSSYIVSAPTTSVKVNDIISTGTGTYFFVVTAVDIANRESVFSNKVIIEIR
jgi:hypothetical protein